MRSASEVQIKTHRKAWRCNICPGLLAIATLLLIVTSLEQAGNASITTTFKPPYGTNVDTVKHELIPAINKADYLFDHDKNDGVRAAAFGFGGAGARSGHGILYIAQGNTRATIKCTLNYYSARGGLAGFGTALESLSAYLLVNGSLFEDLLVFGFEIGTSIPIVDLLLQAYSVADLTAQLIQLGAGPSTFTIERTVYLLKGQHVYIYCGLLAKVSAVGGVTGFVAAVSELLEIKITEHDTEAKPDLAILEITPSNFSPPVGSTIDVTVVIRNIGNKTATGPFNVTLWSDGQELASATLRNLPAYQQQSQKFRITCRPAGILTIRATVDPAPDEPDTTNNMAEIQLVCKDEHPPKVFLERPKNPTVTEAIFPQPPPHGQPTAVFLKATAEDNDAVATLVFYDKYQEHETPIICSGGLRTNTPLPASNVQAECYWDATRAGRGPHRIIVKAVDRSGNLNSEVPQCEQIVHIDRDPPAVSFTIVPLMDAPPTLHPGKKVVDRTVTINVRGQDEGFIQKLWWELDDRTQQEKDFGVARPWQYTSFAFDWNTRGLPSKVDYKVKACASDPFWPSKCSVEQEVIVDNLPPHTTRITDPQNDAQLNTLTFSLEWLAGDSMSGLYGCIAVYKRGEKIDPPKLIDYAIKNVLGSDPDLRQAVDNPSLLGNHPAVVNLGLVVIGSVKAQGVPDIESRSMQFTAPASPETYTFYVIGVDRVGNYAVSDPVTVDVTVTMTILNLEGLCGQDTPHAGQRLTGARVRATPPGTVLATPASQSYARNSAVEVEALDLQLVACHQFGAPIPVFFSHWEIDGQPQPTGRTKVALTMTRNTTARAVYSMTRCARLETDKKEYQPGELVTIRFKNSCQATLTFRNSAPWVIRDSQGRLVFSPIALQVITEVRPGETKSWTWDQRDNERKQIAPGIYTVELETMDSGTYAASFEIKALAQVKLDVRAVAQIQVGPIKLRFEITVPVLVNGNSMITPVSLQLDKGKPVTLTAQQQVTVVLPIGPRTLYFRQWEYQPQGEPIQVLRNPTISFTLTKETVCTVVYEEE